MIIENGIIKMPRWSIICIRTKQNSLCKGKGCISNLLRIFWAGQQNSGQSTALSVLHDTWLAVQLRNLCLPWFYLSDSLKWGKESCVVELDNRFHIHPTPVMGTVDTSTKEVIWRGKREDQGNEMRGVGREKPRDQKGKKNEQEKWEMINEAGSEWGQESQ